MLPPVPVRAPRSLPPAAGAPTVPDHASVILRLPRDYPLIPVACPRLPIVIRPSSGRPQRPAGPRLTRSRTGPGTGWCRLLPRNSPARPLAAAAPAGDPAPGPPPVTVTALPGRHPRSTRPVPGGPRLQKRRPRLHRGRSARPPARCRVPPVLVPRRALVRRRGPERPRTVLPVVSPRPRTATPDRGVDRHFRGAPLPPRSGRPRPRTRIFSPARNRLVRNPPARNPPAGNQAGVSWPNEAFSSRPTPIRWIGSGPATPSARLFPSCRSPRCRWPSARRRVPSHRRDSAPRP